MRKPTKIAAALRPLDYLPIWAAIALGLSVGGAAGALLLLAAHWTALLAFATLLALAVPLALSGQPVAALRPPSAPPDARIDELLDMIELPGGTFRMGSDDDARDGAGNEKPAHDVTLSPFAIGRYPVTVRQYREVQRGEAAETPNDERPVHNVSWKDAVRFCNRLSERHGLRPCYRKQGGRWECDWGAPGYRLPTEAEWEYAARAGKTTRYSFGDDPADLPKHAWFQGNADGPMPVGKKTPNGWGLHDVHGNVFEWCWDRFGDYAGAPQTDPCGPAEGAGRVLRGGSYRLEARWLRSAYRLRIWPENRNPSVGFRCVRASRRQL